MKQRIGFIAPLSALSLRTRLAKMAVVLRQQGYPLSFFGWERIAGETRDNRWKGEGAKEHVIMRGGGYASREARFRYPLWMIRVFLLVLFGKRPRTLFCLGWETAFPALLASYLRPATIIFDDADRFSMILKLPRLLHRLLERLERWTSSHAALHIVPGFSRYDWRHDRMIVLRNTPSSDDFDWALTHPTMRPNSDLVLYINGWVARERGAEVLLQAIEQYLAMGRSLKVIVAGTATDEAGRRLFAHPAVEDHGKLLQREALALYPASDVVITYYDPMVPVNRRAEANKWGDCIFFGTPFIVNSEVETATEFVERGMAFAVPFHDPGALAGLLTELADDQKVLAAATAATLAAREEYQPYDKQFSRLMDQVVGLTEGSGRMHREA